jgi:hypothetical protein
MLLGLYKFQNIVISVAKQNNSYTYMRENPTNAPIIDSVY